MDYERRCDVCQFKYCEKCEEPVYFCMFGLEYCKLTELEKKKIKRLDNQLEDVCCELLMGVENNTLTKEEKVARLKMYRDIYAERKEYLETLMKKGKIFYE